jgi:hypothetical protein
MPALDPVVQEFEADVADYVRDVVRAAEQADRFGEQNSRAALAARQMGLAAQEAAQRAARSQRAAAEAADRLARGEETVERAAQAAARAQNDLARADIAQTRAAQAAARAADDQADQYRQVARDARLAGAAQRLAQLRAMGATEEHDRLLTHLRREFKDLGKDGSGAFNLIGKKASAAGEAMTSPKGMLVKIAAGLGLLPWAASAAASALTLGLGGALIGVGMKAAAGSARVKSELSRLKDHVKDTTREISKPFEATWLRVAKGARTTFDALVPDIRDAFKSLAPFANAFVDDFIRSFEEFKPAIRDVAAAAGPLLDTFGNKMPGLMGRLADTISRVARAADPAMFGRMIDGLGILITGAGHAIVVLSKLADVFWKFGPIAVAARNIDNFGSGLKNITGFGSEATTAVSKFQAAVDTYNLGAGAASLTTSSLAMATRGAGGQVGTLGTAMQLAALTAEQLKAKLDELAGKTLTSRQAARDYQQAVDDATKSLKENGRTLDITTQKGRANQQALDNLATKAHAQAVAFRDSKASAEDVARGMAQARQKFITTSIAMGDTRRHAISVANTLFGIRDAVNSIPSKRTIDIILRHISTGARTGYGYEHHAEGGYIGYANGGQIQGYPGGGMIRGAGSATSDSIPAWLSNGEYVVKAAETDRWRPLLEAVNSGALSKAARLSSATATSPSLARPSAQAIAPAPVQRVVQVTNVTVQVAGTVTAERDLVETVRAGLAGRSANNGGNNGTTTGRRA